MAKKSKHTAVHIVAAAIFALVAIAHIIRIASNTQVVLGNWSIAMWPSWVAVAISIGMAIWLRATAE